MIPTADLLIEPLRILVTALGTGVLPQGNVVDQLHAAHAELDADTAASQSATVAVRDGWDGHGAEAASAAAANAQSQTGDVAADGAEIAHLVTSAAAKVAHAAAEIDALIDSFEKIARALGPALFTPTGFTALLPVAVDHVCRGVAIVERARADLASDTAAMTALVRHPAPDTTARTGQQSADGQQPSSGQHPGTAGTAGPVDGGGVDVTLPDGSVAHAPNQRAATAVRAALSQQGVPYVWGGTTPAGFDCSGLTQWAYHQAGVDLPRLAQDQDTAGDPVAQADLAPGDLAVWSGHVAMYIGNGQMVEAGDPVGVSPLRTTNMGEAFEGFYRPR